MVINFFRAKKSTFVITLIILFSFYTPFVGNALATPQQKSVEERLNRLEQDLALYEKWLELLKNANSKELNMLKTELSLANGAKQLEFQKMVDEKINEIEDQAGLIKILFGLATGFGFSAIIGGFWLMKRWADKRIQSEIENSIQTNKTTLLDLVRAENHEVQLRTASKVLLISEGSESSANDLKSLLECFGIPFGNIFSIHDEEDCKKITYDLMITNQLPEPSIEKWLEKPALKTVPLLAYTTKGPLKIRNSRLNFANSEFTLFSQIMNVLKVQNAKKANNKVG